MRRFYLFVTLNQPWQLIKTLKTKFWLRRLTQLTVGTWWIDISHLTSFFFFSLLHLFLTEEAAIFKTWIRLMRRIRRIHRIRRIWQIGGIPAE